MKTHFLFSILFYQLTRYFQICREIIPKLFPNHLPRLFRAMQELPLSSLLALLMTSFVAVCVSLPVGKSVPSFFFQVIFGLGNPAASQTRSADSPATTRLTRATSSEMTGGIFTLSSTSAVTMLFRLTTT
jgi:hypothetical protein